MNVVSIGQDIEDDNGSLGDKHWGIVGLEERLHLGRELDEAVANVVWLVVKGNFGCCLGAGHGDYESGEIMMTMIMIVITREKRGRD
jgi:hypothetical protein